MGTASFFVFHKKDIVDSLTRLCEGLRVGEGHAQKLLFVMLFVLENWPFFRLKKRIAINYGFFYICTL